ncbi:ABC transporter permease [Paenibacillus dendritiformis]|uniref:ABC transporter permease n=1 Tax=Paenibacillus dendritiformis TaxID=130049 RepID=UPI0018CCC2B7|nr:ABC transporter permease [Paenibacillus dendritiformis]MBG9791226.1 ABC transporter permease [Paenibacillus dendritiformis]
MFLAMRELKHARARFLLIGFIMIMIASLTFIVSGLANGLSDDNASAIKRMKADFLVYQSDTEFKLSRSTLPRERLGQVAEQEGVREATPLAQTMLTLTRDGSERKSDVTLFAIDTKGILMPPIVEGASPAVNDAHEVVVDRSLQKDGVKLGDTLTVKDTKASMKVVGFAEGQTFSHTPVVYMDMKSMDAMMDTLGRPAPPFNAIAVIGDPSVPDTLASHIDGIETATMKEAMSGIPGFKEEQGSLTMMIGFLVVIAAFVQAVFFYVLTLQKTNQYGIIKAIGASTSYLARNLLGQVLLLAVVAVAISIGLTFGLSLILPASMPFELGGGVLASYSGLLVLVSAAGALLSLRRIAQVDAMEAIGRVE